MVALDRGKREGIEACYRSVDLVVPFLCFFEVEGKEGEREGRERGGTDERAAW